MLTAIWNFFTNEARFIEIMHALTPNAAVLLRTAVAAIGLMVNQGILPGGETQAGAWISLFVALVAPFAIKAGDKSPTVDEIANELAKRGTK